MALFKLSMRSYTALWTSASWWTLRTIASTRGLGSGRRVATLCTTGSMRADAKHVFRLLLSVCAEAIGGAQSALL